jgi:broad specificity phosphatase PhoE
MPTDLILVCHGQSAQRHNGKLLGWWADVPLSDSGCKQALLMAVRLRDQFDVDALYTSPLKRAAQTADVIGRIVKVTPAVDPDLREIDSGDLADLSYEEASAQYPDLILEGKVPPDGRLPGGESYAGLHRRAERAIDRAVQRNAGTRVVVVTHGGPIVAYLMAIMGYSWETPDRPRFQCDAISMHHIRIDDGSQKTLVRLNDTAHLQEMPH